MFLIVREAKGLQSALSSAFRDNPLLGIKLTRQLNFKPSNIETKVYICAQSILGYAQMKYTRVSYYGQKVIAKNMKLR
jgi:hypothetical protein